MTWVVAGGFVLLILLAALLFAAFWPEWPPLDDTPLPPLPTGPTAEEWMWSPKAVHRAKHRHENIGEGTRRLPWYDVPTGPQPIHPPTDEVQ